MSDVGLCNCGHTKGSHYAYAGDTGGAPCRAWGCECLGFQERQEAPQTREAATHGRQLTREEFIELLERTAAEVRRDASWQGRIVWDLPEEGTGYLVDAFVRVGNDMGQGGAMLIQRDPE